MSFLDLTEVSKSFGGVKALDQLSFKLAKDEVLGVIGLNGSGKTTLVNIVTGFIRPDSGRIHFQGTDITRLSPHKISQLGIARTFQTVRPFHNLSAFKNLIVPLYSPRIRKYTSGGRWGDRDAVALDLLEEVGFERDAAIPYKPASALPHGYLRRLELARCLASKPELVIMDELFSGLSSSEVTSLLPLLEKLHLRGITLIMVEHRLRELFKIAQRIIVMDRGRKVADGEPQKIAEDASVTEIYLGAEL